MSNFNIYEDQENRVPVSLHDRGLNLKHGESNVVLGQNLATLPNQKSTVQKRTVLSSINISSNVRVQPRRAAKQGVCYESGFPHQITDENATTKASKTVSSTSSTLPSFTIHEDSNSSCSSGSSWQGNLRSASSSGTSTTGVLTGKTDGVASQAAAAVRPKLREITQNVSQSPVKNKLKGKQKQTNDLKTFKSIPFDSPEAMDVSMCENVMLIDTPSLVTTLPREDILIKKEKEFWDVPEYAEDIYSYLRDAEICHKPRANYMQKQTDITSSMRWILVDWLVEVTEEYSLHTETLYLAVSYIDRFLSQMSVKRDKLQLVGTTAMFIASKYEEIYPPDVSQFAYITDNTYRVSQILRMEHLILKVLSFDMAVPTVLVFVNYFTKLCKCSEEAAHLAMFVSELSMLDSDPFLRFLPSKIAASAVALANCTRGKEAWPEKVGISSGYSLDDLRECYVNLHRSFCKVNEPTQHAIRDKYKAAKWHSVSLLSPREKFPW